MDPIFAISIVKCYQFMEAISWGYDEFIKYKDYSRNGFSTPPIEWLCSSSKTHTHELLKESTKWIN